MTPLLLHGSRKFTGSYVLHIICCRPQAIAFGRFASGRPIALPAGHYLYVGSAMGRHATSLAGRLLRHATRCPPAAAHALREDLQITLSAAGLDAPLPWSKHLHWHIDYLLDSPVAELDQVWALRSAVSLETSIADWLAHQDDLHPVARGLGASDHHRASHLLRIQEESTWPSLVSRLDKRWATG